MYIFFLLHGHCLNVGPVFFSHISWWLISHFIWQWCICIIICTYFVNVKNQRAVLNKLFNKSIVIFFLNVYEWRLHYYIWHICINTIVLLCCTIYLWLYDTLFKLMIHDLVCTFFPFFSLSSSVFTEKTSLIRFIFILFFSSSFIYYHYIFFLFLFSIPLHCNSFYS